MRKREEFIKQLNSFSKLTKPTDINEVYRSNVQNMILEVLLDIRDLLTTKNK